MEKRKIGIQNVPFQLRTAAYLASAPLVQDIYHDNIRRAASQLVFEEKGDWIYRSQMVGGSTLWEHPLGLESARVAATIEEG